ncbi:hypothetical protein [Leptospira idonii]|uniref:Glycosyltransferase family 2 protein n=1 Tax=Leptospira idonii TaxID=1193500 RepID=A0A4R9LXK8_9LEPT|nr:hypothetical protein [Leptospira idonii]TGN18301.1 hypothetical protein EHS15_12915 [Leptospira idonii]
MKILCHINHYFGQNEFFTGKSSLPPGVEPEEVAKRASVRKKHVESVINQMKSFGGIDVVVCGMKDYSLVPIDLDFSYIRSTPLLMIYESIDRMADKIDEYDYFINLEDDTFLTKETFENIVRFDKTSFVNEILLPNRLETDDSGNLYCVDIQALPGWTLQMKQFEGHSLKVALNPHSALVIFSKEKFKYALSHIDRSFRKNILANELDSAFAYYHSPFSLFRSEDLSFHSVIHLDRWIYSPGETLYKVSHKRRYNISIGDFFPPIFMRGLRFILKRFLRRNKTA